MNYIDIQNEVIAKHKIDICDGTKCKDDWRRTHAHVKQRRICKWKQARSIRSTFTLLHEIGHIQTTQAWMRRCEEEYYATEWAIQTCKEYGIDVPKEILELYQKYIDREKERGKRRSGARYPELKLKV